MPTSRRQRSYDHRLIALVRETGDSSIARARGAVSARRRPRAQARYPGTDEPTTRSRPSPLAEAGKAAPTARTPGRLRPPANLRAPPRPPNVLRTRTSHPGRSDTYLRSPARPASPPTRLLIAMRSRSTATPSVGTLETRIETLGLRSTHASKQWSLRLPTCPKGELELR